MITQSEIKERNARDARLDADLPPGPCAGCGETFTGALLDDRRLCMACDIMADDATNKAERDAEDRAAVNEALVFWDKVLFEAGLEDAKRMEAEWAAANPWEALKLRERNVKDRELTRRENRQNAYDADDATEPTAGLTFAAFGQEITLLDVERLPSAFVRDDGETLLYEGVANTIFGEPSSGKSWIALMAVIQQLRAGRRCLWWDNEDRASTLAKRLQLLRATDLIGTPELAFITGDMHLSESAMAGALEFLGGGNGPGLVVLDSATAFTCPKDGADVHPWMTSHIKPWIDAGHTSLTLDHVPKQRKDRPMGAVGSFEKLSIIRGAALYAHGTAWNGQQGGAVHLTVHKDAHGQLPSPQWTVVSTISAEWDGPTLAYTIGLPNAKTEGEDLQDELMEAFDQLGADGARGSQGVRGLLKGKRGRDIDKARDELLQVGMIQRDKVGRAWVYTSVPDDL